MLADDIDQLIDAVITDGAWRGAHTDAIQTETGRAAISRMHSLKRKKAGAVQVGKTRYPARLLPFGPRHAARTWTCAGHELWASAGTVFEAHTLVDGSTHHEQVPRGKVRRQSYTTADGTTRYRFNVQFTLACDTCGEHTWWESLTSTDYDRLTKFNRAEYLRVLGPYDEAEWARVYPMRGDVESHNAKVERAFYGQRLPAWGIRNQTRIMRAWQSYMNAAALETYRGYLDAQAAQPPLAA